MRDGPKSAIPPNFSRLDVKTMDVRFHLSESGPDASDPFRTGPVAGNERLAPGARDAALALADGS